jgi:hypothetical protein
MLEIELAYFAKYIYQILSESRVVRNDFIHFSGYTNPKMLLLDRLTVA